MNIEALNIIFENGEIITLNKEDSCNFYISNVKDNGEEIPYEPTIIKNKLSDNLKKIIRQFSSLLISKISSI